MSAYIIWWIVAFALVALELTTGTFYLLVYGLAAAAAGIAAWLGVGSVGQLVIAAVIGIAGTLALKKWRQAAATGADLQDLDIGQSVVIEQWQDRRGQVKYRGALWDAEAKDDSVDISKPLFIRAVRGTILVLGN
jgi:membrane protein implicated in regulation of membrane protease activity